MRHEVADTHTHRVWIGGDVADAIRACRKFTMTGLCVSVQQVEFVYTMGAETGVCVTLINYPRFPKTREEIENTAIELGHFLCGELCQGSFSVEGPTLTQWFSRRQQDT